MRICLLILCFCLSSCESVKYVESDDGFDKICVKQAKKVRDGCIKERSGDIKQCNARNDEKRELVVKQFIRENPKASDGAILLHGLTAELSSENCSSYKSHCEESYKKVFLECGGKIIVE